MALSKGGQQQEPLPKPSFPPDFHVLSSSAVPAGCTWSLLSAGMWGTSTWDLTASAWLPTQAEQAFVVSLHTRQKHSSFPLGEGCCDYLWQPHSTRRAHLIPASIWKEAMMWCTLHKQELCNPCSVADFYQLNGTCVLNSTKWSIWVTSWRLPHCFPSASMGTSMDRTIFAILVAG